jgi:hypothetical protein
MIDFLHYCLKCESFGKVGQVSQMRQVTEGSVYFLFDRLVGLADFFFDPLLVLAASSSIFGVRPIFFPFT